jgi:hypothetical protein
VSAPAALATAAVLSAAAACASDEELPARVRQIVIHVLGGPSYDKPERRFVFFSPPQTQARWKQRFGAHWIVWTDGTIWPRHPLAGQAAFRSPSGGTATAAERRLLAKEAAPVYGHVYDANSRTVGIELAHSGRTTDPFPDAQVRGLAWLVRTLLAMARGPLRPADVVGHKDLDRRPAYVHPVCERPDCPVFVDEAGRPYRRRVDPPESLFARLREQGLTIPRPPDGDAELRRAEALPSGLRPRVAAHGREGRRAARRGRPRPVS